ncbi:MAG: secretin N-terminal domain-containing protein [Phycisphaerales bacterium]
MRAVNRWCSAAAVGASALGALLAGSKATLALQPPSPLELSGEIPPRTTTLPSEVDLARLVDLAAERLRLRLEYDPSIVKSTVTLRLPDALSDEDLWSLTNEILVSRGLALVARGNASSRSYTIVRASDAAAQGPVVDAGDALPQGFVTVVMQVLNRSPKDVAEALRPLLSKPAGTATPVTGTRMLLVSDYSDRFARLSSVVASLDAIAEAPVVEEIPLKALSAASAVASIQQVMQKRDAVTGDKTAGDVLVAPSRNSVVVVAPASVLSRWRDTVAAIDSLESTETRTYTPRVFAIKDVARLLEQTLKDPNDGDASSRLRVVQDDLTSSLIVTATPVLHERIAALIERLDSVEGPAARPVRTFQVRNRPVSDLLRTLQQLIAVGAIDERLSDEGGSGRGSDRRRSDNQRTNGPTQPAGSSTAASTPSSSVVTSPSGAVAVSTPSSRSPLLPGGDRDSGRSGRLADSLSLTADEGTNSIIAVGEPRLLVQVESLIAQLDLRQPQVMLEVTLVSLSENDSVSLGVELEKLIPSGDTRIRLASLFGLSTSTGDAVRTVGDSAGFSGSVLSPGDYNAVVKALRSVGHGRTTTMPKVLVSNNEEASFSSVLQQPVVTTNIISTNVTSSSFGGTQDAGTTISVRPQIAEGDHLVLDYNITLSAFVGASAGQGLPPPRQSNTIQSLATIPDGYTVVVGGLEVLTESTTDQRVPVLGSIPLLGHLFRSTSTGESRSRFFVLIRPVVMRSEGLEDLKYASDRTAEANGLDNGLPEWTPRIVR